MLDPMTIVILAVLAFIITYMVVSAVKSRQEPIKKKVTVTLLECENHDYEEKREFREGDYVGKEAGQCPKCGGKLLISAIFLEEVSEVIEIRPTVILPKSSAPQDQPTSS